MNINNMKETKYLKKEDVTPDKLVTIRDIVQEDFSMENQPQEMKWVMYFHENLASDGSNKPIVLNWTNIQLCAIATGSEDTDNWTGKKIVLFNDPTVSFGGQLTGGIRIRAAKNQSPSVTAGENSFDDDIPF